MPLHIEGLVVFLEHILNIYDISYYDLDKDGVPYNISKITLNLHILKRLFYEE